MANSAAACTMFEFESDPSHKVSVISQSGIVLFKLIVFKWHTWGLTLSDTQQCELQPTQDMLAPGPYYCQFFLYGKIIKSLILTLIIPIQSI